MQERKSPSDFIWFTLVSFPCAASKEVKCSGYLKLLLEVAVSKTEPRAPQSKTSMQRAQGCSHQGTTCFENLPNTLKLTNVNEYLKDFILILYLSFAAFVCSLCDLVRRALMGAMWWGMILNEHRHFWSETKHKIIRSCLIYSPRHFIWISVLIEYNSLSCYVKQMPCKGKGGNQHPCGRYVSVSTNDLASQIWFWI